MKKPVGKTPKASAAVSAGSEDEEDSIRFSEDEPGIDPSQFKELKFSEPKSEPKKDPKPSK
jgi:hypothetical protein